ncbi:MAG: Ig-like domain-containing protein [Candidatus Kapaibacterium sp.]
MTHASRVPVPHRAMTLPACLAGVLLIMTFSACAVVRAPDGGPEDKTPPTVTVADGACRETAFRGNTVVLAFSEAGERASVRVCITVSPDKPMSFDWSGRELTVRFDEALDTASTYALTVGTRYADMHGNTPVSATTVVFSTGPTLDNGVIAGIVNDERPSGLSVYLYPLRGDTAMVSWGVTKPRYRTQVGTDGSFRFAALPDGSYRLIVLRDVDNDGVFTHGTDAVATTTSDIRVIDGSPVSRLMRISSPADIAAPELLDVRPRSSTRIDLHWSEPQPAASSTTSTVRLSDTSGRGEVGIRASYPQAPGSTTWTLITDPVTSDAPLLLSATRPGSAPLDTAGNRMPDSTARMVFTPSTNADALQPRLSGVSIRDSVTIADCTPELVFTWNTAVVAGADSERLRVRCAAAAGPIPLRMTWQSPNRLLVSARDTLASDTWYEWTLQTTSLKSAADVPLADTSVRIRTRTPDTRLFGTLRGIVIDSSDLGEPVVIRLLRGTQEVRRLMGRAGPFAFRDLPPGEYAVDVFADRNADGRYTSGSVRPWTSAERFAPKRMNLGIKPRWSLDDVRIILPAP